MSEHEASNTTTSAECLEELSANPALRIIVASNPATSTQLLKILAYDQDEEVRRAVAGNQHAPWSLLVNLAWEFPREFLHNPVGPLQMVANPKQINTSIEFWNAVLREAPFPSLWWNWLTSNLTLKTNSAVRLHVQSAGEAIHLYGVPQEGKEHDLLTLVKLLTAACAQGAPLLPLTSNTLANQSTIMGEQIIREHLQWLARCADAQVRERVAKNEQTPVEVLRALALDENGGVRGAAAGNEQTPVEVLRALALDEDGGVRKEVVSNEQTPIEILHTLSQDKDGGVREKVARQSRTPVEVLRTLALDEAWYVRAKVAGNEQTPVEVLRTLALDEAWYVRANGAGNKQTPVEVLQTLAQDEDDEVRGRVVSNEQTPVEVLRTLALDEDGGVRKEAAKQSRTPGEVLQTLAQDEDTEVRLEVAKNRQAPQEILRTLALDEDAEVRLEVASNWQTPEKVLHTLAQDEDAEVRDAVAKNRQTPEETLHTLTLDEDAEIRKVANLIQRLRTKVEKPFHQEGWWETLRTLMWKTNDGSTSSFEKQVGGVAELDVSEPVRQTVLAAFAAVWDAPNICCAFSGQAGPKNYKHIIAAFMPPIALQKFAASSSWEVRYLVALHERTPWETRLRLSQDGNRYVRAMARAKAAQMGEQGAG